jgi:hypothetical protein
VTNEKQLLIKFANAGDGGNTRTSVKVLGNTRRSRECWVILGHLTYCRSFCILHYMHCQKKIFFIIFLC